MPSFRSGRRHAWRGLRTLPLFMALLLAGCLALPQTGLFAMRLTLTSLGVENVRIGPYDVQAGLDTSDLASLLASSLGSGSLPIQATLAVGLGLPRGLPPVQLDGFGWTLDVPGAAPISGHYAETVALTPGDGVDARLPVSFDLLGDGQKLAPMLQLARQLASRGELPEGSELSIDPGDVSGLGVTLPSGLWMPTLHFTVGPDGTLQPQA
ncbi:MAG: hypothetical protein UMU75_03045 [Halomonas sp.]|nr:hypothetical protein [Halomonas sp.]